MEEKNLIEEPITEVERVEEPLTDEAPEVGEKKQKPVWKTVLRWLIVCVAAMLIGGVVGYTAMTAVLSGVFAKEKDFSLNGISVTLTEAFEVQPSYTHEAVFKSMNASVYADKYSNAESLGITTAKQYAEYIMKNNGLSDCSVTDEGDEAHFVYTSGEYKYYAYTYKVGEDYWLVQFAVSENVTALYSGKIDKWADSVRFK